MCNDGCSAGFPACAVIAAGDYVSFRSTPHVERVIAAVRDRGYIPALAINPATPLVAVEEMLPEIGMLLLMVNPGFAGQKMTPNSIRKIAKAKQMLVNTGLQDQILLQVDGNCSLRNAPRMIAAGADVLVAGSSSVFDPSLTVDKSVRVLRSAMAQEPKKA